MPAFQCSTQGSMHFHEPAGSGTKRAGPLVIIGHTGIHGACPCYLCINQGCTPQACTDEEAHSPRLLPGAQRPPESLEVTLTTASVAAHKSMINVSFPSISKMCHFQELSKTRLTVAKQPLPSSQYSSHICAQRT
jgi:hypothetical protein